MTQYTTEEVTERYLYWASLPRMTTWEMMNREKAWCRYVEARDGLAAFSVKTASEQRAMGEMRTGTE